MSRPVEIQMTTTHDLDLPALGAWGGSRVPGALSPARRQLSQPTRLRWLAGDESWDAFEAPDGRAFFLLRYPDRGFTVVLLGGDRAHALYLGALGRGGRVLHSVKLVNGQDSTPYLTHMP